MAYDTLALSPKEWSAGIIGETTVGSAILTGSGMQINSISFPTINDQVRNIEKRAASQGRVLNDTDLDYVANGGVHEISMSGICDKTSLLLMLENVLGTEFSSDKITIEPGHNPDHFLHGAGSSGAHNTVCFLIKGPSSTGAANDSYNLRGSCITSLTLSSDMGTDGGRFTFDLTAQSRYPFTSTAAAQSGYTINAPAETYLNMGDFTGTTIIYDQECILDSFSLVIENPVTYLGMAADGIPEAMQRSIPALDITANCTVKYDDSTDTFLDNFRTQAVAQPADLTAVANGTGGNAQCAALYLANNATWASATDFGIKMDMAYIAEQPSLNEGDYMKMDLVLKPVANFTGSSVMDVLAIELS